MLPIKEVVESFDTYEQWKKKEMESLDHVLQMKVSIKDEKSQNTQAIRYQGGRRNVMEVGLLVRMKRKSNLTKKIGI